MIRFLTIFILVSNFSSGFAAEFLRDVFSDITNRLGLAVQNLRVSRPLPIPPTSEVDYDSIEGVTPKVLDRPAPIAPFDWDQYHASRAPTPAVDGCAVLSRLTAVHLSDRFNPEDPSSPFFVLGFDVQTAETTVDTRDANFSVSGASSVATGYETSEESDDGDEDGSRPTVRDDGSIVSLDEGMD
jgi:hypothetical protein